MFNITEYIGSDDDDENYKGGEVDTYTGGVEKYENDRKSVKKDAVIAKLIPDEIPECIGKSVTGHCISKKSLHTIAKVLKIDDNDPKSIVTTAQTKLGCNSEMCILDALEGKLDPQLVSGELKSFTFEGPTDNKLLSNINIDGVMKIYEKIFPGFFGYNFNMLNYASYSYKNGNVLNSPDTLATLQFKDLYNGDNGIKYRTCGCVINADKYQGAGTHWMALFADTRGPRWTIEFFNSSASDRAIAPEWVNWLTKTKMQMEDIAENMNPKPQIEIIKVSNMRHQHSRTECGVYSLFYVYARLGGVPPEYFLENPIPDQLMFEFRQHIFAGDKGVVGGKFDWDKYKNTVNIKWE